MDLTRKVHARSRLGYHKRLSLSNNKSSKEGRVPRSEIDSVVEKKGDSRTILNVTCLFGRDNDGREKIESVALQTNVRLALRLLHSHPEQSSGFSQ